MRLIGLLSPLAADAVTSQLIDDAASTVRDDRSVIVGPGARPALVAALHLGNEALRNPGRSVSTKKTPLLVVTATGKEADDFATALRCYLPDADVDVFPAWETLPHERLSPRADTVAQRLSVLRRLAHPEDAEDGDSTRGPIGVLVVPIRALLAPIIQGLGDIDVCTIAEGQEISLDDLVDFLSCSAYTRVDMVEKRGEFAVRGGIVDVFPPTLPRPVRIDFFGDEIDDVSWFAVADQRSIEAVGHSLTLTACREMLLTDDVRKRAQALISTIPSAQDLLEKISEGIAVEGMESLAPVLVDGMEPLLNHIGERLVVVAEPEKVRKRADDLVATTEEFLAAAWTNAASGGHVPVDLSGAAFASLAQTRARALADGNGWWSLASFGLSDADISLPLREPQGYRGALDRAVADIRALMKTGWKVVVATDGPGPGRRLAQLFTDGDVPSTIVANVDDLSDIDDGVVAITTASAGHGFVLDDQQIALIAESDLTGRASSTPAQRSSVPTRRSKRSVDPLSLRPGDIVVHTQHGVGRFVELTKRTLGSSKNASTREYLVIEYAPSRRGQPGDRLLVPTDALDQVTKYIGGDSPSLNKMGGADWQKTKSKARKAVREIAAELVRLYAARSATQGFAFSPDTPWQRELEEAFPYQETRDQLVTIDEVKADMSKPQPMDRLICGDVGYGKTEIAVRAAFKAIQDGKQVAVLVPTTLLVSQHAETFSERYAGFPVRVAQLSRFQNAQESQEVLEGLADGSIDVVIGTHRLITGNVVFKDLGLVIIDEEQRFGVEHKETLKALRTDVDVLSMSATPIPRTLEMAVTGLRDMSILATPPEDRHPILTYVGAYETPQVQAAIRRELLRDGQVFYVHNRVEDIDSIAAHLSDMIPEARVAVAHGQMGEHRLEQIIDAFWHKEIDVLVCTTIVETGLDVSNANTLIVDRADRMGLSQLHQLRGRVGRGRERAYAYFLYPGDKPLTETALERLRTIASNTDLGAGMQVAMKDLEIRGAGNLLGGEQSGHIAGVGFDLYVRMVSDAVNAFRKGLGHDVEETEDDDLTVELPIDAHVPEDYIPHERLRLEAYSKFAACRSDEQVADVVAELEDRYGSLPEPTVRLADMARLRAKARYLGLREIVAQGKSVRIAPIEMPESKRLRLMRLYPGTTLKIPTRTIVLPLPGVRKIGQKKVGAVEFLEFISTVIEEFGNSSLKG
ncbi:transcription-repair coupling factor [Actinomyces vulturis]|uniref:transcription-repair coupling factor n=1 Tax=Actinomyces vulturis TaxID=1857645 RepID=UPI00082CCB04|nr:transcription-repair coupling factor [Actinomyces vulturis]